MQRRIELSTRQYLKTFEDAWVEQVANDPSDVDGFLQASFTNEDRRGQVVIDRPKGELSQETLVQSMAGEV